MKKRHKRPGIFGLQVMNLLQKSGTFARTVVGAANRCIKELCPAYESSLSAFGGQSFVFF